MSGPTSGVEDGLARPPEATGANPARSRRIGRLRTKSGSGARLRLATRETWLNFRELPAPPNSAAWSAAWRPYVEPCIELFGAERCNFESNFPVEKMGTGYATLWNAFKRITAGCSHTEKLALYSGTAKRLYHLD